MCVCVHNPPILLETIVALGSWLFINSLPATLSLFPFRFLAAGRQDVKMNLGQGLFPLLLLLGAVSTVQCQVNPCASVCVCVGFGVFCPSLASCPGISGRKCSLLDLISGGKEVFLSLFSIVSDATVRIVFLIQILRATVMGWWILFGETFLEASKTSGLTPHQGWYAGHCTPPGPLSCASGRKIAY